MPHVHHFPPPWPIERVAGIRAIEARFADAEPALMERAGAAAVLPALTFLDAEAPPALIVCGPGNNGGDGLTLARLLRERGQQPVVILAGDPARLPADARAALQRYQASGGSCAQEIPAGTFSLAVDALFGIGLQRPLEGRHAEWVARLNALDAPRLALDIPSGLCADTGRVLGCAVRADQTLSFIALKPGLLTLDGAEHSGQIQLATLDLPTASCAGRTVTPALFAERLRPRARNAHKGAMGSAAILGGAAGMSGAALLAARAALKLGAGRVFVGLLDAAAPTLDLLYPELMLREPRAILDQVPVTALAVGPGLGQQGAARELLRSAIEHPVPLLLDADALNLLAAHPVLAQKVSARNTASVLTPHPLEAARLLGEPLEAVQADRLAAAQALAQKFNAIVVLKGCGSIIATAEGPWFINTSGNPGMASAGMGDVLSGLIASLLAQGWEALPAALCGVHLHGLAADWRAATGDGPIGLAAGELADAARRLFNTWSMI